MKDTDTEKMFDILKEVSDSENEVTITKSDAQNWLGAYIKACFGWKMTYL